jgi:hypothetical protein
MPWYSMTAIFHWECIGETLPKFERRVTICCAADEEAATEALLREAKEYPTSENIVFLDDYCIEEIDERPSRVPIEVAHELTIGVDLTTGAIIDPGQFLEQHWCASRIESCDTLGFQHVWHNIDNLTSGCYNCKVVREGQLWKRAPDPKEEAEQASTGQPATRPLSDSEGSYKPQPESEGRSR